MMAVRKQMILLFHICKQKRSIRSWAMILPILFLLSAEEVIKHIFFHIFVVVQIKSNTSI